MKKSILKPIPVILLASCSILTMLPGVFGQGAEKENASQLKGVITMKAAFGEADSSMMEWSVQVPDDRNSVQASSKVVDRLNWCDATDVVIGDKKTVLNIWQPTDELPPGAVITKIYYQFFIDDNGHASNFYPADYEVYIGTSEKEICVYDNLGNVTSHTDGGFDGDGVDDSDIILGRFSYAFNGEAAKQYYS